MSTIIPEERHRLALETCVDVPEESPSFPLPLTRVGISGKTVWVRLAENKGGHTPFNITILVNLDSDRRGIHMSRIEQAITSLHEREFNSLPQYGEVLADLVSNGQKAQYILLALTGSLPFIQSTPISRLSSIDTVEISCQVEMIMSKSDRTPKIQVGAGLHHITACPCTLQYNEALFQRCNDPWPQATHSQRSKTRLLVTPPAGTQLPTYRDLTDILAGVLHISQDLLKRPDETELVLKAHRYPQFAEDAVREVARAAGKKFTNRLPSETRIQVHTLSLESIHIHDVECSLDTNLGDILATLQSIKPE